MRTSLTLAAKEELFVEGLSEPCDRSRCRRADCHSRRARTAERDRSSEPIQRRGLQAVSRRLPVRHCGGSGTTSRGDQSEVCGASRQAHDVWTAAGIVRDRQRPTPVSAGSRGKRNAERTVRAGSNRVAAGVGLEEISRRRDTRDDKLAVAGIV